jgi:hypothetical protein
MDLDELDRAPSRPPPVGGRRSFIATLLTYQLVNRGEAGRGAGAAHVF